LHAISEHRDLRFHIRWSRRCCVASGAPKEELARISPLPPSGEAAELSFAHSDFASPL